MQQQSTVNHISPEDDRHSEQGPPPLRNDDDYDDWDVGMEPIPGDLSWTHSIPEKRP
jgi:hypothetical protein